VKSDEETMEILEAFDLTPSFRDAAELAGCSPHTVAHWVAKRDAGELPVSGEPVWRERMIDPYLAKSRSGWSAPMARSVPTWRTTS
jgi:hypothetical protein